jgi:nucleotide-binding universal stress UspA family protein
MKKIIAAFDGLKYAESTRDYAIQLAKQTNAHLVGVYLDDPTYTSYKIYDNATTEVVSEHKLQKLEAKDKLTREIAAQDFEQACKQASVQFTVHHDRNIAGLDLKHESIYADLLIINSGETLTHYSETVPTRFIRDLLIDVQCPVLVVPKKYKPVDKIILLYDGEPSSVYALKMFSYILPKLKELDTEVITVNPVNTTLHVPDNKLMKEFMKRHYPKATFTVIQGIPEEEIVQALKLQSEHALVVLGAYKRGAVSRWLRESIADILLKELKLPLFIAHNK